MKEAVNFYLPDFYTFFNLNYNLCKLLNTHPEYFYNIKIKSIYGCFPGQIWNGGRYIPLPKTDIDNIYNTIKSFNDIGVSIRFTYTNCLIDNTHLDNILCNTITLLGNNNLNEILCNNEILETYLRNTYKSYSYILSTTKGIIDNNDIEKLCEKYDLVIPDYKINNKFEILENIKDKSKIELLLNAYCSEDCIVRQIHYYRLSKYNLGYNDDNETALDCKRLSNFYEVLKSPLTIKVEDLYTKYYDMGFRHFKIEGRTESIADIVDSYVYYMVKTEYRDYIRNILLKYQFNQLAEN